MRTKTSHRSASSSATDASVGSAQYPVFLPEAEKIPASEVRVAREISLAILNAQRGASLVLARSAELAAVPAISIAKIESIPLLGAALEFAAGEVERFAPITDIKPAIARARALRKILLASADILVLRGLVPAAVVKQIHKGRGPKDAAGDCVALAKLFRVHADAARGIVDVPDADVAAADAIGTKLLAALLPAAARKAPDQALVAAMTARDRLWTLLERTWEQHVWLAGAVLFGRAVAQHVPLLGSRVVGKRAAPVPTPPAPAPAPPVATAAPAS